MTARIVARATAITTLAAVAVLAGTGGESSFAADSSSGKSKASKSSSITPQRAQGVVGRSAQVPNPAVPYTQGMLQASNVGLGVWGSHIALINSQNAAAKKAAAERKRVVAEKKRSERRAAVQRQVASSTRKATEKTATTKKTTAKKAAQQQAATRTRAAVQHTLKKSNAPERKTAQAEVTSIFKTLQVSEKKLNTPAPRVAPAKKPNTVAKGNTSPKGTNTPAWLCQVPAKGDGGTQLWPRLVKTRIYTQFPAVKTIGGYRPGDPKDHGKGLALDVMVPVNSKLGDDIAGWAITHFDELNLKYVIWRQHIWNNKDKKWRKMEDRGSITQNHYDHPHLSFNTGKGTCPAN